MKIVNIVAIAKMKKTFDFDEISKKVKGTEKAAVWLKMRLKPENYYIAFYSSGKFLITGIKELNFVNEIAKRVIILLEDAGINNELEKVEIKNIVMTDEIKLKTPLNNLIIYLDSRKASYEPEQFPGLFYKDKDNISYTLFNSGKLIITGTSDPDKAKENLEIFKELISSFK